MAHTARSEPQLAEQHLDWDMMVSSMHERNRQRRHHSPSVLLARRERMWRLLDRQAPIPGLPEAFCPRPAFDG